jgi:dihydrofolate reductase
MINIIAAVSSNGVVGLSDSNSLPFHYPEDLKHFKEKTINSTIIMGRKTFESIRRTLPKRRNIAISSNPENFQKSTGIDFFSNLSDAINSDSSKNIWLIGGYSIWKEGMNYADQIHLTITPDVIEEKNIITFPWINPINFEIISITNFVNSNLKYVIYQRK